MIILVEKTLIIFANAVIISIIYSVSLYDSQNAKFPYKKNLTSLESFGWSLVADYSISVKDLSQV